LGVEPAVRIGVYRAKRGLRGRYECRHRLAIPTDLSGSHLSPVPIRVLARDSPDRETAGRELAGPIRPGSQNPSGPVEARRIDLHCGRNSVRFRSARHRNS
jgi:hypothetical protein